jgi:hypothetical protein
MAVDPNRFVAVIVKVQDKVRGQRRLDTLLLDGNQKLERFRSLGRQTGESNQRQRRNPGKAS